MGPLFAFLGLWIGLFLSGGYEIPFTVILSLVALGLSFIAFNKKKGPVYLVALVIGIGLGCLRFLAIPFSGTGEFFVFKTGNGYVIVTNFVERFYLLDKQGAYEVGDILRIEGSSKAFVATTYESRFSFPLYLSRLGVEQELVAKGTSYAFRFPLRFQAYGKGFLSNFDTETASLLGRLLFARNVADSDAVDLASEMGLLFALSSSGFFLGKIANLVRGIARQKLSDQASEVVRVVFLTLFLPLSLRKIGILRLWMIGVLAILLPKIYKREVERIELISIAGLCILTLDFHNGYQTGFILGFGLSLFFLFFKVITYRFHGLKKAVVSYGLLRFALLPVSWCGGSLRPLNPVLSLLLIPLSLVTMGIGYISYVTIPFRSVLSGLCAAISWMLKTFAKINFEVGIPSLSQAGILLFIVITIILLVFYEAKLKKHRCVLVFSAIGIYIASLVPLWHFPTSEVLFINVGQGDSILLRSGTSTVLMDTGGVLGFDIAKETLIPYLRKRRIYKIDCLIAGHGDFDHDGGVASLVANYPVRKYVTSANEFPLKVGSLAFENLNVYPGSDENDKSLFLKTTVGGKTYLLTGDAPYQIERKIIAEHPDLRCDILKVGHHGSSTSTCAEFLDTVRPKEAVISCGAKNRYGHPTEEVLNRLRERNIKIRRTDLEGSIVYYGFA